MPAVSHPQLSSPQQRRFVVVVVLLRCLLVAGVLMTLRWVINLSTPAVLLLIPSLLAVLGGTRIAFSRLRGRGLVMLVMIAAVAYVALKSLLLSFPRWIGGGSFQLLDLFWHLDTIVTALIITFLSTVLFWRARWVATAEALLFSAGCITLFSTHRNFRLDLPRAINDISWYFGLTPLSTLIIFAGGCLTILIAYFLCASSPKRPIARLDLPLTIFARTRASRLSTAAVSSIAAVTAVMLGIQVYRQYNIAAGSRLANGVGQEDSAGLSPLGFHSALGSTNQPAALVRLEGDYSENPFSPMMYLREGALSDFNGTEIVIAKEGYDPDVPRLMPEQAFDLEAPNDRRGRTEVVQSVYLLADHKLAFALDYPLRYARLKNPNPGRFKRAYRAVSLAPAFTLAALEAFEVGDPSWTPEVLQHYLEPHSDSRYSEMAFRLTEDAASPIAKAQLIVEYLNANTIYTLTPKHEVEKGADPVAPYLFGDMRGYCVHFAHAMVYMFRALGIPARIGTGYLTDLSQARDGHILLRMSDRHAWSEIYITGIGWVPFDLQPQQVESHADTEVDMHLLEELMGMIDPAEEILPRPTGDDRESEAQWPVPSLDSILIVIAGCLLVLVAIKVWFVERWRFASSPNRRIRWWYQRVTLLLSEMGMVRAFGETRSEFRERIRRTLGYDPLSTTPLFLRSCYGRSLVSEAESRHAIGSDRSILDARPRWLRICTYLSPGGAIRVLMGKPL